MRESDNSKRNKYIYFTKKVKHGKEMIVTEYIILHKFVSEGFLKIGHLSK